MTDTPRLIERAFPLKQTSLASVHEKNVRHGHISTLHIWPARRPLAACRAALLATLLPDPGTPEERRKLCERIGGIVDKNPERKKLASGQIIERNREHTSSGVLGWIGKAPIKSRRINGMSPFVKGSWPGFGSKSGRLTGGGRRVYWTLLPAAAPFHWKPCAWVRSHGGRYQPGCLVHPEMHPGISPETGRQNPSAAGIYPGRRIVHGSLL